MYNLKNTKLKRQFFYLSLFVLAIVFIFTLLLYYVLENQLEDEKSYFEYTEADVKMLGNFMQAEMTFATEFLSLENVDSKDLKYTYIYGPKGPEGLIYEFWFEIETFG